MTETATPTAPEDLVKAIDEEFGPKFTSLEDTAKALKAKLEDSTVDEEGQKAAKQQLNELTETVATLSDERNEKLREVERKSMFSRVETLEEALKDSKESGHDIRFGPTSEETAKSIYGEDAERSFFRDAALARQGNQEAMSRWESAMGEKAMTESTGTTGGFLVPETVDDRLYAIREATTVLRQLFSSIRVSGDQYRFTAVNSSLSAAWVAELAEKPLDELAFGEVSVNVFTKAGMAVVSNQLLADAKPAIDTLIFRDLAKRLAVLEEKAFLSGDGVGKPRGILNTPGVQTEDVTSTDVTALLDGIVNAITKIFTNYYAAPNAIVMHPRTWGRIIKEREATAPSTYLVGPGSSAWGRRAQDSLPGFTGAALPRGELFGYPVITSPNVPTDLGGTSDESAVFVAAWDEGLILDRQGVTLDSSEHVFFTTNQTIFRAEDRVGFTAARYPEAFCVVQGDGLAAG